MVWLTFDASAWSFATKEKRRSTFPDLSASANAPTGVWVTSDAWEGTIKAPWYGPTLPRSDKGLCCARVPSVVRTWL